MDDTKLAKHNNNSKRETMELMHRSLCGLLQTHTLTRAHQHTHTVNKVVKFMDDRIFIGRTPNIMMTGVLISNVTHHMFAQCSMVPSRKSDGFY